MSDSKVEGASGVVGDGLLILLKNVQKRYNMVFFGWGVLIASNMMLVWASCVFVSVWVLVGIVAQWVGVGVWWWVSYRVDRRAREVLRIFVRAMVNE